MSIWDIAKVELLFIGALFFPLILQLIVLTIVSRLLWNFTHRQFGYWVWVAFALVGVPIHELSHALAFWATGAGVSKMVLFAPRGLPEHNGATGVVIPKRKPSNFSLLIASIAPLFGCTLLAWLVLVLLIPDFVSAEGLSTLQIEDLNNINLGAAVLATFGAYFTSLFETLISINWLDWRTYLALYLAASLGMGAAPSNTDLKYFFPACLLALLFLFPVFAFIVLRDNAEQALLLLQNAVGQATLSVSVAVNYATLFALIALVVLWVVSLFHKGKRGRRF